MVAPCPRPSLGTGDEGDSGDSGREEGDFQGDSGRSRLGEGEEADSVDV